MDIDTEARFIGQEHRFFRILFNFITRKERFPDPKDPRRAACVSSLCWNLFSPSSIAAAGGLVATLTLILLWWQNQILKENNSLIATTINPEQRYIVSIGNQVRILRTVNEGNNETIEIHPLGLGSVLFLDLNLYCSGNSPLVIEQFDVNMKFNDGDKSHTVRFFAYPRDSYRQVIRPGEISLIDARLVPVIERDDEITRWAKEHLSSGEISFVISGRDVKGQVWGIKEKRIFSYDLLQFGSRVILDSTTFDFLPPEKTQPPTSSLTSNLDLPEGNRNRVIGTYAMSWGINTEHNENGRLVSRMVRQDK
jgi:hypothetical protein